MVLGLYEKTGRSRAQDCVGYAEHQMEDYGLPYSHLTAVVTDTEATMVAAGRLFVEHRNLSSLGLGDDDVWIIKGSFCRLPAILMTALG